jgi:hypothetical protein
MSYELGDPDDRCCDEQREADIWNHAQEQCERYGVPFDPVLEGLVEDEEDSTRVRRERTPQEEAEWLEDKRSEHEADRVCGHHWSAW